MNIITGTTKNLADAFMHYVCIRMQFRSTMLKDSFSSTEQDKRCQESCPTNH